jgi:hypothetical protein
VDDQDRWEIDWTLQHSEKKTQQFALAIYGSRMRRQDASLAYNFYYTAIIGYTLAATKMLVNQCDAIQSPVICATLKKWASTGTLLRRLYLDPRL